MFDKTEEAFRELNYRLQIENISLTVIVAGGYVLNHYGMRSTHDVDGFYHETKKVTKIIEEVGNQLGMNTEDELWLNNSVQNMNAWPPENICQPIYELSNLRVLMPPLDYIAGMKLMSAREQDILDVAGIIKREGITDPHAFLLKMEEYGFSGIDESVLLEAFGTAYGMDWLERYYIDNEEIINQRIRSDF